MIPRTLVARAKARAEATRLNEIDRALTARAPQQTGFAPTSGGSATERAYTPWMPHDYRPVIGFSVSPESSARS